MNNFVERATGKTSGEERILAELSTFMAYHKVLGPVVIRKRTAASRPVGSALGSKSKRGYMVHSFHGKPWSVHQFVWLWHYGKLPKMLDHINGDKLDNRIENLREVTHTEQNRNRKLSTTGTAGISYHTKAQKWRARIGLRPKEIHLGVFDSFTDAFLARQNYLAAHPELGFTDRHG